MQHVGDRHSRRETAGGLHPECEMHHPRTGGCVGRSPGEIIACAVAVGHQRIGALQGAQAEQCQAVTQWRRAQRAQRPFCLQQRNQVMNRGDCSTPRGQRADQIGVAAINDMNQIRTAHASREVSRDEGQQMVQRRAEPGGNPALQLER